MIKFTSTNYYNKKWLERSCGLSYAFEVLGGRWKPNVLWKIYEGINRYGDIKRSIPGISEKVLYERLRELEEDNLIIKINNTTTAAEAAIVYNITDLGMRLIPVLKELWKWGDTAKTDIFP